jgi:hypothetical protein
VTVKRPGTLTGASDVVASADSGDGLAETASTPWSAVVDEAPEADVASSAFSAAVDEDEELPP